MSFVDDVVNSKEAKAAAVLNPATVGVPYVATAVANAGLTGQGNDVTNALGQYNPFKKADVPSQPNVVAPGAITAPGMPAGSSPVTVGALPANGFTGGTIKVPGAPDIQTGDSAFRQNQLDLVNQLSGQAAGTGPSVAANQLAAGQEANVAATIAAANSARGAAQPAIARSALQTAAEIQGKAAQEAATARLQEQMQAAGLLGQVAGQAREGDISQANMANQAHLDVFKSQLQAAIAQGQMDQQTAQTVYQAEVNKQMKNADLASAYQSLQAQYAAMGFDAAKANQMAALQVQQLQQSGAIAHNQNVLAADQGQKQMIGTLIGAAGQTAAFGATTGAPASTVQPTAAPDGTEAEDLAASPQQYPQGLTAASDAALKEDIQDGDPKIRNFLDAVKPYDYKYKSEKHGKGRFVSPMAQDLLKSEVGRSMVFEGDDGLMVNYGRGFGALLAAQASLNKRLDKLEKKKV